MNVLITGAAGRVGRAVRKALAGHHTLRLFDPVPIEHPEGEFIQGSVTDRETVRKAIQGMQGVVHLAFGKDSDAPPSTPEEWSVDVNLKGTYNMLLASRDEGVRRFIYASTMSIYDGNWPKEGEVFDETVPPVPRGHYSLTKYLGEEMVRCFANAEGLSSVCLRLTGVAAPEVWEHVKAEPGDHYGTTHSEDVGQAFRLALEKPGLSCEILNICGDLPTCRWSFRRAHAVLGYSPKHRLYFDNVKSGLRYKNC